MAKIAIIIGNGFDLDLGLPSRYSDFIQSEEWEKVVNGVKYYLLDDNYRRHSLIAHLQQASQNLNWFDIEEEIHSFVINHPVNSSQEIRDIKSEFDIIKKSLTGYLKRVSKNLETKADESRLASLFLCELQNCNKSIIEILYNYTIPHTFIKEPTYYNNCQFTYVHGCLKDNNIVLGCDLQNGERVNRGLSFMYKYNMLTKANHVAKNILEAKEIVFFGHSMNEMDFGYFKDFFKAASAAPLPTRNLTIITYDDESERVIKDNIRNQGISVTDLYNNLFTFDFIRTKNFYEGNMDDVKKMGNLIERLLADEA